MNKMTIAIATLALLPGFASADDLTIDSAIGGAIGGALGGALGAELGGREGAIVGSGIGAAVGTSVNTRDHDDGLDRRYYDRDDRRYHDGYRRERRNHSSFCPPGQAKKGRC